MVKVKVSAVVSASTQVVTPLATVTVSVPPVPSHVVVNVPVVAELILAFPPRARVILEELSVVMVFPYWSCMQ